MEGGERRHQLEGAGGSVGGAVPHRKLRCASALNVSQRGWRQGRSWGGLLPLLGVSSPHQPPCSTVRMARCCFPLTVPCTLPMPPIREERAPQDPSSTPTQVCVWGPVPAGHSPGMDQHGGGLPRPQAPLRLPRSSLAAEPEPPARLRAAVSRIYCLIPLMLPAMG